MSECVLDTSAVLAVICSEPGSDAIMAHSQGAFVSTVNLAEVYSKTADVGFTAEELTWAVKSLQLVAVPLCEHQAILIGRFREPTRRLGLSLGDRACLALGFQKQLPVLTADCDWAGVDLDVEVRVFRNQASHD